LLEAVTEGEPLIAVAATMQRDPQAIMVHENSPVKTFADLDGKAVAVKRPATWLDYLVKRYQLHDVREVPATFSVANFIQDPNYIQQIFVTSEPYFAKKAHVPIRTLLISDTGYSPYRVIFTSQSFAKQHPDIVTKFVRASLRGWRDYLENPKEANATISQLNPAMSVDQMQFTWQSLKDGHFISGDDPSGAQLGQLDAERWAAMYRQLTDLKIIRKPIDPSSAYTVRFLPAH
jgi:NitT/TauT family transport system substrate-binding protein